MEKITDETLQTLIDGLKAYKEKGVVDPWVLDDGSTIEPLEVLKELQSLRSDIEAINDENDHLRDQLDDALEQLGEATELLNDIKKMAS